MKKILALILCGTLCFGALGCEQLMSKEQKEAAAAQETAGKLSEDIRSGEFAIDGVTYTFPLSMQDLIQNGWHIPENYANKDEFILEPWISSSTFTMYNEDGSKFIVASVINLNDEDSEIEKCMVNSLKMDPPDLDVVLPGGVYKDSGQQEIEAIYGEPDEKEEKEWYANYRYAYLTDGYKCRTELTVYEENHATHPLGEIKYELMDVENNGVFFSDYAQDMSESAIFELYFDNIMNTVYHGDYAEYVKSGAVTEEEAVQLYESAAGYYADALLYYIGLNEDSVDTDTKAKYTEFAKKVLAKTKWEIESCTVAPNGVGQVNVNLYPTTLFDVVDEPLSDAIGTFRKKYAGTDPDAVSEEEAAAMGTELAQAALEKMEGVLDQIDTGEAESAMYLISDFGFDDDTWNKIDNIMMDIK
ncbi:MAG: hypothetical protein IJ711_02625 [Lachnospiraceae bacterium]|nr:hypothetical protein [Lachnospiraceae bacterium]